MFDDLSLFVRIVESGSLRAAAKQTGMPAATLTRRLQKLEEQLGCRLLHRSARNMQPTGEGWQYYERCRPLLQSLQQATEALDASNHKIAGSIRLLAPITLASGALRAAWSNFMSLHADICLELKLSNQTEDLIGSGADIAIRVGQQPDSLLNQRLLGNIPIVTVASPSYLAATPPINHPAELEQHAIVLAEPIALRFRHNKTGEQFRLPTPANPRFRVNEIQLAVDMAIAGLGILHCPLTQAHAPIAAGNLHRILPEWAGEFRPIYAVWPQQRHLPARVRALLDYLIVFCAESPLMNGSES